MRCKAKTKSGKQCKNEALTGRSFCHLPAHRADKKGFDRDTLIEQSLDAIQKHNLVFQSDLIAYLPCSKPTFYNYEIDEVAEIKKALEGNRINMKVAMRGKWYESDQSALQIALMKLISDDDERRRMAMEYRDHTSKGDKLFDELKNIIPAPDED